MTILSKDNLVSVVMPCFNAQEYIEETLLSVLNQSHSKLEIIIVDDCSTDKTTKIINNYIKKDPRIKLYKMKKNFGGPAGPRNYGLKKSSGNYIAFIDSDDIWHPSKIEIQIKTLQKENFKFCSTEVLSFKSKFKYKWFNAIDINQEFLVKRLKNLLIKNYIISGSSVLVEKNILKNIYFNESNEYKAVEDYHFWLQVHEINNISSIHLSCPLVFYRNREESISSNKFNQALKIYNLLKNFKIDGKKFMFFNYYYFFTYVIISLYNIYIKKNTIILK
tara:strand:+ start:11630 stop:12460 length:831 start_codon:yes stop_codon:yes gene_type:complete